jgi:hypothetical protein
MRSQIKLYHCDIIGKDVVFKVNEEEVSSRCEFYHPATNPYRDLSNLVCSIDFPENKVCFVRHEIKREIEKQAEEKSRLVRESNSVE